MNYKLKKSVYYIFSLLAILAAIIYVPFEIANTHERAYLNDRLEQFKEKEGKSYVDKESDRVKEILKAGEVRFKDIYTKYSSLFAILSCILFLAISLYWKNAGKYDSIVAWVFVAGIYSLGSINALSFFIISVLCMSVFLVKKAMGRRGSS